MCGCDRIQKRGNYGAPCQRCGAPHMLDTAIDPEIWNRITDHGERWGLLCNICIDELCQEIGVQAEARFYYVHSGLISAPYSEMIEAKLAEVTAELENLKAKEVHLEGHISFLEAETARLRAERDDLGMSFDSLVKTAGDYQQSWEDSEAKLKAQEQELERLREELERYRLFVPGKVLPVTEARAAREGKA